MRRLIPSSHGDDPALGTRHLGARARPDRRSPASDPDRAGSARRRVAASRLAGSRPAHQEVGGHLDGRRLCRRPRKLLDLYIANHRPTLVSNEVSWYGLQPMRQQIERICVLARASSTRVAASADLAPDLLRRGAIRRSPSSTPMPLSTSPTPASFEPRGASTRPCWSVIRATPRCCPPSSHGPARSSSSRSPILFNRSGTSTPSAGRTASKQQVDWPSESSTDHSGRRRDRPPRGRQLVRSDGWRPHGDCRGRLRSRGRRQARGHSAHRWCHGAPPSAAPRHRPAAAGDGGCQLRAASLPSPRAGVDRRDRRSGLPEGDGEPVGAPDRRRRVAAVDTCSFPRTGLGHATP